MGVSYEKAKQKKKGCEMGRENKKIIVNRRGRYSAKK
jgi:hypothetical protein